LVFTAYYWCSGKLNTLGVFVQKSWLRLSIYKCVVSWCRNEIKVIQLDTFEKFSGRFGWSSVQIFSQDTSAGLILYQRGTTLPVSGKQQHQLAVGFFSPGFKS